MRTHKNGISFKDFFFEKNPFVILTYSGQKCPIDGTWETIGAAKTVIFLSKDQITPTYLGKKVSWKLRKSG